jgi:hypothetical protein
VTDIAVAPTSAPSTAPLPPTKDMVQLIDECVVNDNNQICTCTHWGYNLRNLMTADRVKQLSSDEYAHLVVTIGYMFARREAPQRFDQINAVYTYLAIYSTRHILDEELHEYVSTWSRSAYNRHCLMLLFAVANNRAHVPHITHVVDVLCCRIGHDIETVVYVLNAQWTSLFALLSVRQALCFLESRKGFYAYGESDLLTYFAMRLQTGPIDETIDALRAYTQFWTDTADAVTSKLGIYIWVWLCGHPTTCARALEVCRATCYAPLDGWLLVRKYHQQQQQQKLQLPHLVGEWDKIRQRSDAWVREEPAILLDIFKVVKKTCLGSFDAATVLVQAWPFMDEAMQTKIVAHSVANSLLVSTHALIMAFIFEALVPANGPIPHPLGILVRHILEKASLDTIGAVDALEVSDGHPSLYRLLVLVYRATTDYRKLLAYLAIRCTETQLCRLGSMDAQDRSRLYADMVHLVPKPSNRQDLSMETRPYIAFSTHARRAYRLHSILARLAQHEGWADFVPVAALDTRTRALLITRHTILEQACRVHLIDDLARLCIAYI